MKCSLAFIALLTIILFSAAQSQRTTAAGHKHRATVEFTEPVQLLNVTLQGRYLIVHDDELMARGEACTFVYKADEPNKLVASFHCIPVERRKVGTFTFRTGVAPDGKTIELREFQFAGETEAHQVPINIQMKTAVVGVAS
jgi:hypothetical protein